MKLKGNHKHCDDRIRQRSTLTAVLLLLFACYHSAVQSFSPPVHRPPALSPSHTWNTKQPSTTQLYAVSQWGSNIQRVALRIFTRRKQRPKRKPYQPGRPASYEDEESNPKNPANRPSITADDSTQSTVLPTNDVATLFDATTTQPPTTHTESSTTTNKSTISSVDLSGSWKLVVHDAFLQQYQEYLTQLGQPFWVRSMALSMVARTTEETLQTQQGESLWIKGTNVRGTWERTLWTTAASDATLQTADGETVSYEAWWEGPVHVSWLRGVQKYGGGSFESRRYLMNNETTLVCESTFHPDDANRETARVTWTFVAE